jgi:hypothetical protein
VVRWLRRVVLERVSGKRPSRIRALLAACMVAAGAGVLAYRALRA